MFFKYLACSLVTWLAVYKLFYEPKSQIKRIWKDILKNAHQVGQLKNKGAEQYYYLIKELNEQSDKAGLLINALLDYYFSDGNEENKDFVEEHRYEQKFTQGN